MADISSQEFNALRELLLRVTGIALNDTKRELLRSRLQTRLRVLGLTAYGQYHRHLRERDPDGVELGEMVNAMTTNKTSFFREPYQFDWLRTEAFPAIKGRAKRGGPRRVRVWSAGCSTGAEPYTIAMLLRECFEPGWELSVLASDIDTEVLGTAAAGEFAGAQLEGLEQRWLKRYFLRGRGATEGRVKVRPELRQLVTFRRINLIQPFATRGPYEIIFCRNVSIYFNRETQTQVFGKLAAQIVDGGHLLVGHSECLSGMGLPLAPLRGNIYRKEGAAVAAIAGAYVRVGVGSAETAGAASELTARVAGSIAVCVYDPGSLLGGLAHLPGTEDPAGAVALAELLERLGELGAATPDLEAKVVASSEAAIAAVRGMLAGHGVRLVNQRVLPSGVADVRFLPSGGRVRLTPVADRD